MPTADCRAAAAILSLLVVVALLAVAAHDPPLAAHLVGEGGLVEWLQVVLSIGAGALAVRQGRAARRAGRPATLEVAIVAAMAMLCIGEVDLDRMIFGTKVIATRFFVNPEYPLSARALAVVVIVGVPAAVGIWLLIHVRHLWRAVSDGRRRPWGQAAASGMALFVVVELVEKPLNHLSWLPPYFAEETLELVSALGIFVGLVARQRAIMSRMSVRSVVTVVVLLALGLAGCRSEHPAAAQDTRKPQAPPPREVRVVPAAERDLPRTVIATGTLAAEEQVTLSAKVAGRVEAIEVDLGTRVRRGRAPPDGGRRRAGLALPRPPPSTTTTTSRSG